MRPIHFHRSQSRDPRAMGFALSLAACSLIAFFLPVPASAQMPVEGSESLPGFESRSLIVNPGFEKGVLNPFVQGATNGELSIESLPEHVYRGRYSMKHVNTQASSYTKPWFGSNIVAYHGAGLSEPAGEAFRLTAWAKTSTAGSGMRMYVFCLDPNQNTSSEYWSHSTFELDTEWQEFTHTHVCPAETPFVSVRLDNRDAGTTVWWDDLTLTPVTVGFAAPSVESIGHSQVYDLGAIPQECDALFDFSAPPGAAEARVVSIEGPVTVELQETGTIQLGEGVSFSGSVRVDEQALREFERQTRELQVKGGPFRVQLEVDLGNGALPFFVAGVFRGVGGQGIFGGSVPGLLRGDGRYFSAGEETVYLSGSHTWNFFQEWLPTVFPWGDFLDMMRNNDHNFMRLWAWENPKIGETVTSTTDITPLPWVDNGGTFDLYDGDVPFSDPALFDPSNVQFNTEYFTLLKCRVAQAREEGIYVDVMLFQGWSVNDFRYNCCPWNPWVSHPFNAANNEEGVDGGLTGGDGERFHTVRFDLSSPQSATERMEQIVAEFQKAYIREVVDTLKDQDNVLYEVSNESEPSSLAWQKRVVTYVQGYEAQMGYPRHPVGISSIQNVANAEIYTSSAADWISPHGDRGSLTSTAGADWARNPPEATGAKVVVTDTDHIGAVLGSTDKEQYRQWVWKSFTRGHNPIVMDAYHRKIWPASSDINLTNGTDPNNAGRIQGRRYLGDARRYADRMNLGDVQPQARNSTSPSDTGYSLYNTGQEYLVYQPDSGSFRVDLPTGVYLVEWFNPRTGQIFVPSGGPQTVMGGSLVTFASPMGCSASGEFKCDAVLYLLRDDSGDPDLFVDDLQLVTNPFVGPHYWYEYTVENGGDDSSPIHFSGCYVSYDTVPSGNDLQFCNDVVAALNPGGAVTFDGDVEIPDDEYFGWIYLLFEADTTHSVAESVESNNVLAAQLYVPGGPGPDLAPGWPEGPYEVQPGDQVTLACDVANEGDQASGTSILAFYLSPHTTVGEDDVPLAEVLVDALEPGESVRKTVTVTVPSSASQGWNFWIYEADHGDAVPESHELNNSLAISVDVQ